LWCRMPRRSGCRRRCSVCWPRPSRSAPSWAPAIASGAAITIVSSTRGVVRGLHLRLRRRCSGWRQVGPSPSSPSPSPAGSSPCRSPPTR
jgi:hypothetical protein